MVEKYSHRRFNMQDSIESMNNDKISENTDNQIEDMNGQNPEKSSESESNPDPVPEAESGKKKVTIGGIINNILTLITSRLFTAGLLIFLGIRVALNPTSAPSKIAWGLGLAILIATVGLFIGFITTKGFNRSNLVPIIETILFTILGGCMIIFSDAFGVVLEEMICVAIIVNCTANLLCLRNFDKMRSSLDAKAEKNRVRHSSNQVITDVGQSIKDDFTKYNGELINAAAHVKRKANATTLGQITLNVILIIAAFVMLFTRFSDAKTLYLISGIILVLSGLNDGALVIRGYLEKRRAEKLAAESGEEASDDMVKEKKA